MPDADELLKKPLLTPQEFGQLVGAARNTVYTWAKEGTIKTVKIGKLVRIPRSEFERLLESASH